jgi:hypothetical protein
MTTRCFTGSGFFPLHCSILETSILVLLVITALLSLVAVVKHRLLQRRRAQRANGLARSESTNVSMPNSKHAAVQNWHYCRFWRSKNRIFVWARDGLSLDDVRRLLPGVFPRETFVSFNQAAGIFRLLGADFIAVCKISGHIKPPRRLKHPPRGATIGINEETYNEAIVPFSQHGLILVGGVSGQGKTALLRTLSEAKNETVSEVFSLSGADFPILSLEAFAQKLGDLVEEIKRRDWSQGSVYPQKVLIVDEFLRYANADKALRDDISKSIGQIAAEGRKYGICVILASQKWSNMPTDLFTLASGSIAFRLGNAQQGEAFVADRGVVDLKPGHVIAQGMAFVRAHVYFRKTARQ